MKTKAYVALHHSKALGVRLYGLVSFNSWGNEAVRLSALMLNNIFITKYVSVFLESPNYKMEK